MRSRAAARPPSIALRNLTETSGLSRGAPHPSGTAEPYDGTRCFHDQEGSFRTSAEVWPRKRHVPPRGAFSFPVGSRAEGTGAAPGRQAIHMLHTGPFCRFARIE